MPTFSIHCKSLAASFTRTQYLYVYPGYIIFMFLISEIRCTEPVLAEHGILSVTGNDRMYGRTLIRTGTAENSNTGATSYKIGALVKYRCERGYKVVGEPLSTCEENGKWSGEVPQCVCKCTHLQDLIIGKLHSIGLINYKCVRYIRINNGH